MPFKLLPKVSEYCTDVCKHVTVEKGLGVCGSIIWSLNCEIKKTQIIEWVRSIELISGIGRLILQNAHLTQNGSISKLRFAKVEIKQRKNHSRIYEFYGVVKCKFHKSKYLASRGQFVMVLTQKYVRLNLSSALRLNGSTYTDINLNAEFYIVTYFDSLPNFLAYIM